MLETILDEYYELRSIAVIYYAYDSIHQYLQVSSYFKIIF